MGKSEAKHPIGLPYSQHFPNCRRKLYQQNIFSVVGTDMLELDSSNVRQVSLQCKKQNSSIESMSMAMSTQHTIVHYFDQEEIPLARTQ